MDGRSKQFSSRISVQLENVFFGGRVSRARWKVAAGVLALGLLLPGAGWGQAMGKAALEGPSPWPVSSGGDTSAKSVPVSTAVLPSGAAGGNVTSGPLIAQAVASTVGGGANAIPKVETKEPVRTPAAGGTPVVPTVDVKPPEVPVVKAGGAGTAEPSKPAVNSIEQSPIGGHAAETPVEPSKGTDNKNGSGGGGGWGLSGLGGVGQTVMALAIVIGLIFIGRGLARKFVPGARASNGKGVIEILARHPLAKNQSIVLVRIGSQIVALNQGKETSESVLVISDAAEVARIIGQIEGKNPNSIQAGFNKLLANARMDLEESGEAADAKAMDGENLDEQLEEMAAAKRQLMELRQHVRSVRDSLPRE